MAKKKAEQAADGTAAPAKGRSNLVPAIVIAVGLLGGGFFLSSKGSGNSSTTTTQGQTTLANEQKVAAEREPGEVLSLDTITLNLADGHFLKVGLALQLAEGVKPEGEKPDPKAYSAKALDTAITVLGGHTFDELVDPKVREQVKTELSKKVSERYEGDILSVYFTEFVMQ